MPPLIEPARPETSTPLIHLGVAVAAILLFFFLAVDSVIDDSPTMDEQNHIARGIAFLRTGDPRLSVEHPPLVNSLSGTLLLTIPDLTLPLDHPSWEQKDGWYEFARQFLWNSNADVDLVVFLARLPIIFLALILGLSGYRFAKVYWQSGAAALAALLLFLFEPNLLAHGRYATTDMGAILFTFLTTMALMGLWFAPERWSWQRWALATLTMGLAFSSKLSTLAFVPVWLLLAIVSPVLPARSTQSITWMRLAFRRVLHVVSAGIGSLLVIWLAYGLQWGPAEWTSDILSPLAGLSLPMPTFWVGLEQIAGLGLEGRMNSFMLGQFSESGFVSYFPVAFLTKSTLPLLLMAVVAIGVLLVRPSTRRRALFLLLPFAGVFVIMSVSALNIGYRHVLPALPYLLVLVSGLASPEIWASKPSAETGVSPMLRRPTVWIWAGVLAAVISAVLVHPHYLSFFNVAAGGPQNGYRVLIDSNLDWGQDMKRLHSWMADNEVEEVKLGWFGTADPDYYGIAFRPLPGVGRDPFFPLWWDVPFDRENPEPGIYAISATSLWETPLREDEKTVYSWFRQREPDDRVGYSILIYDVR